MNDAAEELIVRLDGIQTLADELAKCQHDASEQMELAAKLHREIVAAKQALKPLV